MKIFFSIVCMSLLMVPAIGQVRLNNQMDSVSYCLGIALGSSISGAGIQNMNNDIFMKGILDATGGNQTSISIEEANKFLNEYVSGLSMKKAVENLEKGKQFLAENSKKPGVITLPSGLQYIVKTEGTGAMPVDTSYVTVHYTGRTIDGKVFDSSVERGEPIQFPVNGVIPGWTEALKLMKEGSSWTIFLPAELAYGEQGNRGIEPNSVLIFDVQLIKVE